jgi:hypothetical protein
MTSRPLPDKFLVAFSFAGEQRDLVRAVAEAVEAKLGSGTVFLDEWFEYYIAGADADVKLQRIYGDKCALAVVCVSTHYGGKPWTQAEHEAVRARQMKARSSPERLDREAILPIRVGDGDVEGILFNSIVPDIRKKSVPEAATLITDRLNFVLGRASSSATAADAAPDWPETPPPLVWPMANHSGVREAFAALVTRNPTWRFLPVRGASETGKSHITRQMLANALQIPELACGRFDFKGGTDIDGEVRAFIQELDIQAPPPSPQLNERLAAILTALIERKRPTLLVFDTYEAAPQPQQDWVEKELLIRLVRAPWLRVVIAGQRVPEAGGAIWGSVTHAVLQLAPPRPAEWFDFGKQHRPGLKLEEVETACRLASNKASLLCQLLGPAT